MIDLHNSSSDDRLSLRTHMLVVSLQDSKVSEPNSSLILVDHLHVYNGVWLDVDLRMNFKKDMVLIS